jgi:hypothetical protein
MPVRWQWANVAIALVLLLLAPAIMGLYDHGPPLPRNNGYAVGEGFPSWVRDDYGRVCAPCTVYDPTATAACLSTYVSSLHTPQYNLAGRGNWTVW